MRIYIDVEARSMLISKNAERNEDDSNAKDGNI
jgi:hypothetical protein